MPVAVVYGWHDVLPFCAGSPFSKDICEWDMMGPCLAALSHPTVCDCRQVAGCNIRARTDFGRPTARTAIWRRRKCSVT